MEFDMTRKLYDINPAIYLERQETKSASKKVLLDRGFKLIQMFYRNKVEKRRNQSQMLKERLWDESVGVLLRCVRCYKPNKYKKSGTFEGYLYYCLTMSWANQASLKKWQHHTYSIIRKFVTDNSVVDSEVESQESQTMNNDLKNIEDKEYVDKIVNILPSQLKKIMKLKLLKYTDFDISKELRIRKSKVGELSEEAYQIIRNRFTAEYKELA